jgi:hypothetical protein
MQLIAKTFEEREKSRIESEKLSMRRSKLDKIKWLYERDLISREDFHAKVSPTDSDMFTSRLQYTLSATILYRLAHSGMLVIPSTSEAVCPSITLISITVLSALKIDKSI